LGLAGSFSSATILRAVIAVATLPAAAFGCLDKKKIRLAIYIFYCSDRAINLWSNNKIMSKLLSPNNAVHG
jgi:hypothetical protein